MGLLRGKRAACHWAFRELLPPFEAGRPELARAPVVAAVRARFDRLWPERLAIARRAAAAMDASGGS